MRRVIGLLSANRRGPWVYIGDIKNPLLQVDGAEGELVFEHAQELNAEQLNEVVIPGDGCHTLPAARYCRIRREHSSDILCLISSS